MSHPDSTRPEAASRVSSQPPRNDGSALGKERQDAREAAGRLLAQEKRVRSMAGKMLADDVLLVARAFADLLRSSEESASVVAGLSADVTRLEAELEARSAKNAETRMEHLRPEAPYRVCNACRRHSWGSAFAEDCGMPQPDGTTCPGSFGERVWPETCGHCHDAYKARAAGGRCPNPLSRAAEVRVKELEATQQDLVSAASGALASLANVKFSHALAPEQFDEKANTWLLQTNDDGSLKHTDDCEACTARVALARLAGLASALPDMTIHGGGMTFEALPVPVPVGPDGEAAGPEANSTHPVEIRGMGER